MYTKQAPETRTYKAKKFFFKGLFIPAGGLGGGGGVTFSGEGNMVGLFLF